MAGVEAMRLKLKGKTSRRLLQMKGAALCEPALRLVAPATIRFDEKSDYHSINFLVRADVDEQQSFFAQLGVFLFGKNNPAIVSH